MLDRSIGTEICNTRQLHDRDILNGEKGSDDLSLTQNS